MVITHRHINNTKLLLNFGYHHLMTGIISYKNITISDALQNQVRITNDMFRRFDNNFRNGLNRYFQLKFKEAILNVSD